MNITRFLYSRFIKSQVKYFSLSAIPLRSYYDSLGITPSATQSDIKNAYYKLSKIFHPDKNKGCAEASKKFQDISNAYEILGNFKLRKLYDKGMLPSSRVSHAQPVTEYPEHPEAKFYKSRETRHTVSNTGDPIYDFDEWSRAHYGAMFQRRQNAKRRWAQKMEEERQMQTDFKTERVIFVVIGGTFLLFCFSLMNEDLDNVKRKKLT